MQKKLSHGNHQALRHKAIAVTHTDTLDMCYTDVAPTP
jgi:hypothetical protein